MGGITVYVGLRSSGGGQFAHMIIGGLHTSDGDMGIWGSDTLTAYFPLGGTGAVAPPVVEYGYIRPQYDKQRKSLRRTAGIRGTSICYSTDYPRLTNFIFATPYYLRNAFYY